jgi:hypothetical protein
MCSQEVNTDNVTDFVAGLGTSATLSIPGVDAQQEIDDVVELLERVFVEIYASGFVKMITELMQHMATKADDKNFDWLPVVEDWALAKLDES